MKLPRVYIYALSAGLQRSVAPSVLAFKNLISLSKEKDIPMNTMLTQLLQVAHLLLPYEWLDRTFLPPKDHCDTVEAGFQCNTNLSHFWGHYSPYFAVESDITDQIPSGCEITFAQVLSRHGARYPTSAKNVLYRQIIEEIQANVTSFDGAYSFLSAYTYSLGSEDLTRSGEQELVNSGIQFAHRYRDIVLDNSPFVRSASAERCVRSAENWVHGYQREVNDASRIPVLVIPEGVDFNNTLNHGLCTNFEEGPIHEARSDAKSAFAASFVPAIQARLNKDLPGAELTMSRVISLMDLCSFETVASLDGSTISPFCLLFTQEEWHAYNYYQTLDKYYGRGTGCPLGTTQGVGFINELLARMTDSQVIDNTSSNRTLDSDPETFPLGRKLYADFSHDNDMTSILFALGLYNNTVTLSNETLIEPDSDEAQGYAASWTVPFGARIYFEKMSCESQAEEFVRVVVNGRVVPLVGCDADDQGMCALSKFVESQSFARGDGRWDECFS